MRIAIVDDLALARETLRRFVSGLPGHTVAWVAEDGEQAVQRAAADRPDVVLMDLVMPVLDGVEATRRIMAASPCPILFVTSSVTGNFSHVMRGMEAGGIDAVNKPTLGPDGSFRDAENLVAKLEKLSRSKKETAGTTINEIKLMCPVVAIGASTGGPQAIAKILPDFNANMNAAIVVAVHIDAFFTSDMQRFFQDCCPLPVVAVRDATAILPNQVYLAVTNDHMVVNSSRKLVNVREPAGYLYRPSVDEMFASLAANWPRPGVAALLTGMGKDGAKGLLKLKQAGWRTFAQDEATSVVYGMPKEAAELRAAHQVLPIGHIAGAIRANLPKG